MNSIRTPADLGLLVVRLVTGLVFLMHGYQNVFTYGFAKMGAPAGGGAFSVDEKMTRSTATS